MTSCPKFHGSIWFPCALRPCGCESEGMCDHCESARSGCSSQSTSQIRRLCRIRSRERSCVRQFSPAWCCGILAGWSLAQIVKFRLFRPSLGCKVTITCGCTIVRSVSPPSLACILISRDQQGDLHFLRFKFQMISLPTVQFEKRSPKGTRWHLQGHFEQHMRYRCYGGSYEVFYLCLILVY